MSFPHYQLQPTSLFGCGIAAYEITKLHNKLSVSIADTAKQEKIPIYADVSKAIFLM